MKNDDNESGLNREKHSELNSAIPFLLAGLEGHTDGVNILSISLQRARDDGFRVVLKGNGNDAEGHPIRVVAFSNGEFASIALLAAEDAYRSNVIRWHLDRFAEGINGGGKGKTGKQELTIRK